MWDLHIKHLCAIQAFDDTFNHSWLHNKILNRNGENKEKGEPKGRGGDAVKDALKFQDLNMQEVARDKGTWFTGDDMLSMGWNRACKVVGETTETSVGLDCG